ncbi:MAG: hypothetical protein ACRC28_08400 [Clostridium sp.]|uniref:hypothetical protein n=1 Tax=Clostridium sp. TaxID=1506 RepID=UPI003F2ED86A
MKEIQMNLVQTLMINGNKDRLKSLEKEAEINYSFEKDNGKEIKRKKGEGLGEYIERYSVKTMENFSRKKYENLKSLCNEYNTYGDSKIVDELFTIASEEKERNGFEKIIMMAQTFVEDIFKNTKKKFV